MASDVTGNFSAPGRMAHVNCILQPQLIGKRCKIVGVRVHIVAIPRLRGTPVPAPIMRDDSVAALAEEKHLSIPIVRGQRPSVAEHYGLALSPVLVENLRPIFSRNRRHNSLLII